MKKKKEPPKPIAPLAQRDYFAAKAMEGIVSAVGDDCHEAYVAQRAYEIADAMLKERAK